MTQQLPLSVNDLFIALFAGAFAAFYALRYGAQYILRNIQEKNQGTNTVTWEAACRYARATAAGVAINYSWFVLVATSTLALGLGVGKTTLPWMQLILPDKVLGFVIILSYTGLISGLRAIGPELGDAIKKLLP